MSYAVTLLSVIASRIKVFSLYIQKFNFIEQSFSSLLLLFCICILESNNISFQGGWDLNIS